MPKLVGFFIQCNLCQRSKTFYPENTFKMCFHFRGQRVLCCSIHLGGMTMDRRGALLPEEYHQVVWGHIVAFPTNMAFGVLQLIFWDTLTTTDFFNKVQLHLISLRQNIYILSENFCVHIQTGAERGEMEYISPLGLAWGWRGGPWVWHIWIVMVGLRDFIFQKKSSSHITQLPT